MRSAPANAALPGGRLEEQQWVISTDILVERSIVHFHGQFDRMCQIVNVAVRAEAACWSNLLVDCFHFESGHSALADETNLP